MSASDQEVFNTFIENPAVAAYVGKNFDFYRDVWSREFAKKKTIAAMRGNVLKGGFFSFNLPGLFFPVFWGFYRKNIKPAAFIGLILFGIAFMDIVFGFAAPGLFYLAIILIVGGMANAYYFDQVWDFMEENKQLSPEDLKQQALAKGGTSVGLMFAGALAYSILLGAAISVIRAIMA